MTMTPEQRKALKETIGAEVHTYLDRLTPNSKFATFEISDWEPMLEDIIKTIENFF